MQPENLRSLVAAGLAAVILCAAAVPTTVAAAQAEAPNAARPATAPTPPPTTTAPAPGMIELAAQDAHVHGSVARFMVLEGLGNICYWTQAEDWVSWDFRAASPPGECVVLLKYSCQAGSQGTTFEVALGDQKLACKIAHDTGTWYDHEALVLGRVTLARAGEYTLSLKPLHKPGQAVMNLAWIRLIPAAQYPAYQAAVARQEAQARGVFVVPNFHPASCGWLTDFSTERNYCGYSYLAHLDRVRDDPNYCFAISEVNNMMAILEFEPQRFEELKRRVKEGRVELANAFFLEPTINLSGGEALVKMGIEGLRWQREVMGASPRLAWTIDVTGVHEQMGQIVSGLGLDGMVYTRDNPTGRTLHWFQAPDGSRTLAISPGHYSDWGSVFTTKAALDAAALEQLVRNAKAKARGVPPGAPVLVLGGAGDYALPPARKQYPEEFLRQWKQVAPNMDLRFTGPSAYLDAVLPQIRSGQMPLPTGRSGARLTWSSFWIQAPRVKGWYRRAEQGLQAAEALATLASTRGSLEYPVQPLYHAWLQMLLNMDRNTLWGAAGGMVFEHPKSWDVRDRFESVEAISHQADDAALHAVLGKGECLGVFNPLNWGRTDPVLLKLPAGRGLAGVPCQGDADGQTLCRLSLPSLATAGLELQDTPPAPAKPVPLPGTIETPHYTARVDAKTGAIVSLKLKPSGREVLAGPILLVAESGGDGHNTPLRPQRKRLADSAGPPCEVTVAQGPLATVVEATSRFLGGPCRRSIRFYRDCPRIDFDAEVSDIPNCTVVVAEFPLAQAIREVRRGIPYGFSHGAWPADDPKLPGYTQGILAAIRWSHYQFADGGGVAILDRGLPGRELTGQTPVLFLLNAQDFYMGYPCSWLSGKGRHHASFALYAHECGWKDARVPQMAWEFNCPPVLAEGVAKAAPKSFARTSGNAIVQAVRREGADIEVRLAECLGLTGPAWIEIDLPHKQAALTDLLGGSPKPLSPGPRYELTVRPQQIVTLRLRADKSVPDIKPLLKWDPLVPPGKLAALKKRLPNRVGHPPAGSGR